MNTETQTTKRHLRCPICGTFIDGRGSLFVPGVTLQLTCSNGHTHDITVEGSRKPITVAYGSDNTPVGKQFPSIEVL